MDAFRLLIEALTKNLWLKLLAAALAVVIYISISSFDNSSGTHGDERKISAQR